MATMTFAGMHTAARPPRRARSTLRPSRPFKTAPSVLAPSPAPGLPRPRRTTLALLGAITLLHLAALHLLDGAAPARPAPPRAVVLALAPAPPLAKPVPPPPPPPRQASQPPQRVKAAPAPVRAAAPAAASPAPGAPASPSQDLPPANPASESVVASAAPAASAPAPAPVAEEPLTEPRGYAGYLRNPAPDYPPAAQKRGLEGQVVLKVHVLASGQPDSVAVARSSGHAVLDEAAVKAVAQWTFAPARRGKAVTDGWVQVPLTFKI